MHKQRLERCYTLDRSRVPEDKTHHVFMFGRHAGSSLEFNPFSSSHEKTGCKNVKAAKM